MMLCFFRSAEVVEERQEDKSEHVERGEQRADE